MLRVQRKHKMNPSEHTISPVNSSLRQGPGLSRGPERKNPFDKLQLNTCFDPVRVRR